MMAYSTQRLKVLNQNIFQGLTVVQTGNKFCLYIRKDVNATWSRKYVLKNWDIHWSTYVLPCSLFSATQMLTCDQYSNLKNTIPLKNLDHFVQENAVLL